MNRRAQLNQAPRALLILFALASLCLTDAAGPRLLPFPPALAVVAASSSDQPPEPHSLDSATTRTRQRALTTENYQVGTLQQNGGSKSNQFHPLSIVETPPALLRRTEPRARRAAASIRFPSAASPPPGRAPPALS